MATLPTSVELPIDPNADPNRPSLEEALEVVEAASTPELSPVEKLARMAGMSGDISGYYSETKLNEIGARCVENYERDKAERKDWEDVARKAIAACSQEEVSKAEGKTFPWKGASDMRWPLLTVAALQFNARMYPAIVKGDEAVLCKVIGQDNGKPKMGPNPQTGEIQPLPLMGPDGQPVLDPQGHPQFDWAIPPGAKAKRARRVSEYLNTVVFYRMPNWEDDTDQMCIHMPAAGCMFRKVWADENGQPQSATVSALNLVVPSKTRTLDSALRITELIEGVYPYEIEARMRSDFYRTVQLTPKNDKGEPVTDEDDGARDLLEQHCRWDFDEDGLEEPYIVTVDFETRQVLRIEPNFGPDDIKWKTETRLVNAVTGETAEVPVKAISIQPRQFYVKYGMFPHPSGKFYDIGLGHLLDKLSDGINTMLNQLIDAGTAQTAGGGFIGSGVRLQARGGRGVVRWTPGEYKTVDASGDDLRRAIVDRTLPTVSPVTFQVLDMILGASRDIAGIKDVMTGEASNTGQVGTTLALIEQGLQVFNAAAKRLFRSLKNEFELLFEIVGTYGGEAAAQDYEETLDDPEADFGADFSPKGLDIRPVSDPASITRMQKMAKAQFRLGLMPQIVAVGGDGREVVRRTLEAIDEEDIEKILPPPPPPDPQMQALQQQMAITQLRKLHSEALKNENSALASQAKAALDAAEAQFKRFELATAAGEHGTELGIAAATVGQQ